MAVKRVIKGVHVIPMGFANAFLIEADDGLTLIDAGFPRKEAVVFGAIRRLGRSPAQLKQLMFTHGHPDHIGSAAAIVRETRREFVENKQSFERETSAVGAQKLKSVARVALETPKTCTSIHEQCLACNESSFVPGKKRDCSGYFYGFREAPHRHAFQIARLSFAARRIVSAE
jgi:metal-dependent hydrolase (beta-lactamase superfamily II)